MAAIQLHYIDLKFTKGTLIYVHGTKPVNSHPTSNHSRDFSGVSS